jgi:uncharacterized protein YaiL (DUF2058 family)
MQNLRDKLLKAGLVTAEQAEKVETASQQRAEQRPERGSPGEARHSQGPLPAGARGDGPFITARIQPRPAVPKLPPLAGSKASQRLEAKRQLERDRQLRERVHSAQISVEPGERTFYFVTRKNRLRRLELSHVQADALEQGRLAVVERPDPAQIEHALVPAELALELLADYPKAVRFLSRPEASVGFLTDSDVRERVAAEAAETPEERALAEAAQSEEQRAAEAAASSADAPEASATDGTPLPGG